MNVTLIQPTNILARLWTYQTERFPLFGHGILIAAFSFSAICFSTLLRGDIAWPAGKTVLVGFVTALLFFLQLRIADEFKDFDEDARYRPYRPVPRGLVTLRELGIVGALAAVAQLLLALWLEPELVPLLAIVWGYLALMSKEFFVRSWLKARPITYLWTHMLIVPLIDFYVTACDWRVAGSGTPHGGLVWFLIVSFFNGIVIELGRKIRAPADEEPGVETYSALWGLRPAVFAWLAALAATAIFAWLAAGQIGFAVPAGMLLGLLLSLATLTAVRFLRAPETGRAKQIETMSGVWTLLMYLGVGTIPLLYRLILA